jgi:2-haloalkanoic acid dehalogenase type II
MQNIRAVTLDAYGTVFDFEDLLQEATAGILDEAGEQRIGPGRLAEAWGRHFHGVYEAVGRGTHAAAEQGFLSITRMTEMALADAGRELGFAVDAQRGTALWIRLLNGVKPFPEIPGLLRALSGRVRLAMVSDTDEEVIGPALKGLNWPFEFVLTSEGEQAYKYDAAGRLFRRAIEMLDLASEQVLHVGDSAADVAGARRAGMRTAWVNRYGRPLPDSCPRPDFVLPDLADLPAVVERFA